MKNLPNFIYIMHYFISKIVEFDKLACLQVDKPSEPFEVIGKIIPRYENENWTFTELLYEAPYLKSYQDEEDEEDEEADCLEYIDNTDKIIYLLYRRYRRM